MAVSAAKAFGQYLRTLRSRAGLSLQEVEDLARNTPGPISKNYLSRCENGQLGLALSKMTILCKIYSVPSDVVLERMELDLELEQIGGPDTENMSYEELIDLGVKSIKDGDYWPGYACYREATILAGKAELSESYKDHREQTLIAAMNGATAAMRLGRNRFATHEFNLIEADDYLSPKNRCFLLNRLANASRYSGNYAASKLYSDESIRVAEQYQNSRFLPYFQINRASIAIDEGESQLAIELSNKAQRLCRTNGDNVGAVNALYQLGQAYLLDDRLTAATRIFDSALKESKEIGNPKMVGLGLLNKGRLENQKGNHSKAAEYWRSAKRHARRSSNSLLSFQADLCLLEQAIEQNLEPQKRNAKRRLARMAPFMPQAIDEIHTYRRLLDR